MKVADVSVIVRSCGRPMLLRRALASLDAQTCRPKEIVIVAIGAEGRTALKEVISSIPMKTVLTGSQRVRGAALNDGIASANGRWLAFLDDDDTWAPTFLAAMVAAVDSDEADAGFAGAACQTELIYERHQDGGVINCGRKPFNPGFVEVDATAMTTSNQFTINAVLWHRRVFSALGGFREELELLEDWEFNLRAVRRFRLCVVPQMLARYHRRPPGDPVPNTNGHEHDRVARALQAAWRAEGVGGEEPASLWDMCAGIGRRLRRAVFRLGSTVRWWFR